MQKKIFVLLLLVILINCKRMNFQPTVEFYKTSLKDLSKSQKFLQQNLIKYQNGRANNYTLYLAVKNYVRRLKDFENELR